MKRKRIPTWILLLAFWMTGPQIHAEGRMFSAGINLLSLLDLGTFEADLGMGLSRHTSVHVKGIYNPFIWENTGNDLRHKQLTWSLQGRYWPWYQFAGWYVGGKVQHSLYNRSGWKNPQVQEGTAFGLGAEIGYNWMLNKHLNLEFAAGCWGGYDRHQTYATGCCGRLIEQDKGLFFQPDRFIIGLQYIF